MEQRKNDPNHVRNLQHTYFLRSHLSRSIIIRFRKNYRYRLRLWRWCFPHRPNLRRILSPPRYRQNRISRKRLNPLHGQIINRNRLKLHLIRWVRNSQRYQRKIILCCFRLWWRNETIQRILLKRQTLWNARWLGHDH